MVQQPDGTTVRKYYVEGENGAKLPVLDSTSDDPKEVERQLKEWQNAKMKELEEKYNVQFSRDGQKDNPLGKEVNLRSPRINELLALEEGLRKSEPSTTTPNGKPILVQFAVEPTSSASAYVFPRPDGQQRILFEPIPRQFGSLKGTILHEWAHNAEHNMETRDKALSTNGMKNSATERSPSMGATSGSSKTRTATTGRSIRTSHGTARGLALMIRGVH